MIEKVAGDSAAELRAGTATDVDAGLADLHVRRTRHRRRASVGAAAAIALAVGVGWTAGSALTRGPDEAGAPVTQHGDNTSAPGGCAEAEVRHLGGRSYRFGLVRPVVWRVARGFGVNSGSGASCQMVESYQEGAGYSGVTVMEGVRASGGPGVGPARGVADDPRTFVRWVSRRPYLSADAVVRTVVDGRPAWRVRVVLAPRAGHGTALCNDTIPCHAITYQAGDGGQITGIWADMAAEYTAFDLPGAGTTVVWTWAFTGSTRDLSDLDRVTNGLSWPAP